MSDQTFRGPDFPAVADMAEVGSLLARAVDAGHDAPDGDREIAAARDAVSELVGRAPAYPRG